MAEMTPMLQALMEEYKSLSSTLERISTIPFEIIPLVAALVAAFGIFKTTRSGTPSETKADESGFAGVAVTYAMAIAVTWFAFLHSMAAGYALRLTRIELLINRATKAALADSICWHGMAAASFGKVFPGYGAATLAVIVLGAIVMALAVLVGTDTIAKQTKMPSWLARCILVFPFVLSIALLLNMAWNEYLTACKKQAIFEEFKIQAEPDYDGATLRKLPDVANPAAAKPAAK